MSRRYIVSWTEKHSKMVYANTEEIAIENAMDEQTQSCDKQIYGSIVLHGGEIEPDDNDRGEV